MDVEVGKECGGFRRRKRHNGDVQHLEEIILPILEVSIGDLEILEHGRGIVYDKGIAPFMTLISIVVAKSL